MVFLLRPRRTTKLVVGLSELGLDSCLIYRCEKKKLRVEWLIVRHVVVSLPTVCLCDRTHSSKNPSIVVAVVVRIGVQQGTTSQGHSYECIQ